MKIIEVYNLKKKFKDHYVVKGVTFDVKKGEIFGFLGKNGAGCQGRLFFPQNRRFKIPQKDLSLILLFFFLEPLFP